MVSLSAPQANPLPHFGIWPTAHARPVIVLPARENKPLPAKVNTFSLPLKVFQSAELTTPVVLVSAVGKVRFCTDVSRPWLSTVSCATDTLLVPYEPAVTPVALKSMLGFWPPVVASAVDVVMPNMPLLTNVVPFSKRPFPAAYVVSRSTSAGNTYYYGYCTWYAKQRRPDLPNRLGNGGQWVANAAAQGYATGSAPRAGAVAETTGHVAYVESVNGDGTIVISEMNGPAGWGVVGTRTVPASQYRYIY